MQNVLTPNGYELSEVVSALQKCIRRGNEELAMYFAIEMVAGGYVDYMWRRLTIIASEDIGIADPFCAVLINVLRQNAEVSRGNAKKTELNDQLEPMQEAILYMCRSPKTRYGDDFLCYVNTRREQGWKPEIPDEAIDMHTKQGKLKGRGEIYFCQESAKVSNESRIEGPNYWAKYCEMCDENDRCTIQGKRFYER